MRRGPGAASLAHRAAELAEIPSRARRRAAARGLQRAAGMFGIMVVFVAVALTLDGLVVAVVVREPRPYTVPAFAILGALLAAWPLWHCLAPRPLLGLRAIGWIAGWIGICLLGPTGRQDLALYGRGLVALVLYVEIARALLDRRDHRSALVPEMRVRRLVARARTRVRAGA
jgi:hypothetical protein